jgi:hypothetical protein
VVAVSGTGGRISVAAPVCSRPGHRGRLCYPILVYRRRSGERRSFCEDHSAEPIAAAPVPLTAPIILNWDNLNGHRSFALHGFCNAHRYVYLHSAIDGFSRLAYTEALDNETAKTAIGFFARAQAFFAAQASVASPG